MSDALLTIFTPTFNRSRALSECYKSLCQQTVSGFIWHIIDDGSTDDTEVLVKSWQEEALFEIRYQKVPNGGKARAVNKSWDELDTKLWLCLDSDDTLVEGAVNRILNNYSEIEHEEDVCGLFSL